jgi:hypothetical protein
MIGEDRVLLRRWNDAIEASSVMLENPSVPAGTRYDAIRMVAMLEWTRSQSILNAYLHDSNAELQMGAVSGLSDVPEAKAAEMLIEVYSELTEANQSLARAALLKSESRCLVWLNAMALKRVPVTNDPNERKTLLEHSSREVRTTAQSLFGEE